jgi:hypothetical protein
MDYESGEYRRPVEENKKSPKFDKKVEEKPMIKTPMTEKDYEDYDNVGKQMLFVSVSF